jgi:hypothetical protein
MVLKNIPMSNDITVKKSLALAGIIILIYSLISLDRWGFELNIFTEESYVMLLVGLILVYPLCKEIVEKSEKPILVDKEILVDKDLERPLTLKEIKSQPDFIIGIIILCCLFLLIFSFFFSN